MKARPIARPTRGDQPRSDRRRPQYSRDVAVDYVEALLGVRPQLAEEPDKDVVRRVAGLLADLDGKRYLHTANDGTLSIPFQELDEAAPGKRGGKNFFEKHQLLGVVGDDYAKERTRRYMRHPDIAEMDRTYDQKYRDLTAPLVDLFMQDGRMRREIPRAIASKDDRGNTAKLWGDAPVQCVVPVNLELLRGACTYWERQARSDALDAHNRQAFARMARLAGKLIQRAHTKVAGRGNIIIQYQESASGRLYGIGPLNLQNVKRLVRFAAMHGMVDYDLQNCHYSILRQLANQRGVLCPTIDEYLAHKSAVRSRLAKEIGCGLEQIKQCLIALIYGASVRERDEYHATEAIADILIDQRAIERFQQHPWIACLVRERDTACKAIVSRWKNRNRGMLVNAVGKGIAGTESMRSKVAHLLQGVEAAMLRAMVGALPDPATLMLLQHDGFTCSRRLDVRSLELAVLQETGFTVTIDEKIVQSAHQIDEPAVSPQRQPVTQEIGMVAAG